MVTIPPQLGQLIASFWYCSVLLKYSSTKDWKFSCWPGLSGNFRLWMAWFSSGLMTWSPTRGVYIHITRVDLSWWIMTFFWSQRQWKNTVLCTRRTDQIHQLLIDWKDSNRTEDFCITFFLAMPASIRHGCLSYYRLHEVEEFKAFRFRSTNFRRIKQSPTHGIEK